MRNLRSYFTVIFDTKEISDDHLRKFTEVHLRRLAADNPQNVFTPLLTATTAAYDAYFGALKDEDTKSAIQQGLTKSMNGALHDFIRAVRRREGTIKGEFDKPSPTYEEFFPHGLEEYNQATLATVETLMTRFANAASRHVEVLGQPFADRFLALKNSFIAARAAQLSVIGEVKGDKVHTAETRDALEDQLMDNVLMLAMKFKRKPDAGMAYFDQSIIRRPEPGDDDEPPPSSTAPKGAA